MDQAVQYYRTPGDGTNWHHDRSIFNGGRAFTFLTVIHNTSDQELKVWTQKYGIETLPWKVGKAVIIEKFKTVHAVSTLHQGERILLTLTYVEKPYYPTILHPIEYFNNKAKNCGYIGMDAFTPIDYIIMFIMILIIITIIYYTYNRFAQRILKNKTRSKNFSIKRT